MRKEAYDFFTNQQQNIEQGGLFAPMPSNERGNIKCLTDSERYVLGYIEVSTTAYIDRFFSVYDEMYSLYEALPIPSICWVDLGGTIPTECIDCRWTGATKKKPAYWPNNHE